MKKSYQVIWAEAHYGEHAVRLYLDDRQHYVDAPMDSVMNNWDMAALLIDREQNSTPRVWIDDDGIVTVACAHRAYRNPKWELMPITKGCRNRKHCHIPHFRIMVGCTAKTL